jgi:hypothetical protein
MRLLTSQKNELFNIIKGHSFSPNQFSFNLVKDNRDPKRDIVRLVYEPNPEFYFLIADLDDRYGGYLINYSPGESQFLKVTQGDRWDYIENDVNVWLYSLAREIGQEDLWANLTGIVRSIGMKADYDDSKFTSSQFVELSKRMKQLQVGIATLELPQAQIKLINKKLDDILSQGKTLSKFDWQSLFLGAIMSLMIALSVTSEVQHQFWQMVKQVFNGVLLLK